MQITSILSQDRFRQHKIDSLLQLTARIVNGAAALFYVKEDKHLRTLGRLISKQLEPAAAAVENECAANSSEAIRKGAASIAQLSTMPAATIISCPVTGDDEKTEQCCLSVIVLLGGGSLDPFLVVTQLLAVQLSQLAAASPRPFESPGVGSLLRELTEAEEVKDLQSHIVFISRWLNSNVTAIGMSQRNGKVRLKSISDVARIDQKTTQAKRYAKVMQNCLQLKEKLVWPPLDTGKNEEGSLVLKELVRQSGMTQGLAIELPGAYEKSTLLVFLWSDGVAEREKIEELIGIAPTLGLILQALGSTDSRQIRVRQPASDRVLFKIFFTMLITTTILTGTMLFPVTFKVHGDCRVVPVQTRYVVARLDSLLQEVFVEPGNMVQENAKLARLDGREIDLELQAINADAAKAMKLRDNHLASGNAAAAQLQYLEYQRLEERRKLLTIRKQQLNLQSPIDGIILSGDLKREVGGPVSRGKPLFEIAPLDTVLIELAIADEDIAHVAGGAAVTAYFNAFPARSWNGTISYISPKSELVQGQNAFIVSFEMVNEDMLLQPGMQGQAEIVSGKRNLFWVYFHKPWHALVNMLRSAL